MSTPNEEMLKDVGQDKATKEAAQKYDQTHGTYKDQEGGKATTLKPSVTPVNPIGSLK